MRNFIWLLIGSFLMSCGAGHADDGTGNESDSLAAEAADTLPPFEAIPSNFETTDLLLPEGFTYTILFQEGQSMVTRADGQKFPAKGYHDLSVFIPDEKSPDTKGIIYISHEDKYANDNLGDGGGATVFDIELIDGHWTITSDFHHIDFSSVGGTNRNCGGSLTPNGTVFTCEEAWAWNTEYLYYGGKGMRDTTWRYGRPLWQNTGYIVEVDPRSREVIGKHWKMGKYVHEDAHCTADGKYVYLSDDNSPGIFYRFETVEPYDYSDGQLYAYKQSEDGESGSWIKMPMDTMSLVHCTKTAISLGATMFIRHEWIEEIDGKLYISETGEDNFNWDQSYQAGGTVPKYVRDNLKVAEGQYDDIYGRVLVFDPSTNKMSSYLEGGHFSDSSGVFSNPDCNTSVTIGKKTYLVLSEDINWCNRGRVSAEAEANQWFFNELYFLDMSIENPTVDDLLRFAVAPKGSETTGVIFLPNGDMIINIQHPGPSNPAPFNSSCTVLVEGFNR